MTSNPAVRRLADWSAAELRALADEYGTPLYVQDLDRTRQNFDRVAAAFPDADVHYAVKANAGRAVLRALREAGASAECAAAGEVFRAIEAGYDPREVHYTAVNPPDADLDYVLDAAPEATFVVGARDTIDRLAERGFAGRLALRVHPGVGAGHSADVATGADAKFGVPHDEAASVLGEAAERGFDVVGIHAHVGSGMLDESDVASHREVVERLVEVARESPVDLSFVDVGGGFGVPYHPQEEPLDLESVAATTRDVLADVDAAIVVEPGRYLVADAGVLLTEVNTVKPTDGATLAGVDAGMTTLLRPALYGAHHEVRSLDADAADRDEDLVSVVGPICESTDVLAEDRRLPHPERGDLLAVGNAGAYGIEMVSQYNSRPRPAVVAVEGGDDRLVRERDELSTLTAPER
ncbi:diaminopimelate decarboxylase [Halobacterium wangiae]|uniref:diaminopimelate decarboxylase n=1 Tax=Halobacterium wangiae TaxID=2902623 RepID=UPI001E57A7C8|nr:diaminopimelate decarboxylase [Halobacterium wangiae]